MYVKDRLPGIAVRIENRSIAICRNTTFPRDGRSPSGELADNLVVIGHERIERLDVTFGNDEDVGGRLGIDVVEGEYPVVFVNDGSWNFPSDDAAEQAGGHTLRGLKAQGSGHAWRSRSAEFLEDHV